MRNALVLALAALLAAGLLVGRSGEKQYTVTPTAPEILSPAPAESPQSESNKEQTAMKISVQIGEHTFTATLADTKAALEFAQMLPMTVEMSELNGNEKYHYMDTGLTAAAAPFGTIENGDLMLWGSDCVVLFYKTFSSGYSYTRLGKLDDPSALAQVVGGGNVSVTFRPAD